jgi:AP-2 complex subunit mu-1
MDCFGADARLTTFVTQVLIKDTRMEIKLVVKALFDPKFVANNVEVRIPTPPNTAKVNGLNAVRFGRAKYKASENAILWRIRQMDGGTEASIGLEVETLTSTSGKQQIQKPTISMTFQVPMVAASGLVVRYLKVVEMKLNYTTTKWVRYLTKAGQYEIRT